MIQCLKGVSVARYRHGIHSLTLISGSNAAVVVVLFEDASCSIHLGSYFLSRDA
jgi:hypothetical protein